MLVRRNQTNSLIIGLLVLLLLAACGPAAEPPLPTRTPAPTFTPTPEGQVVSEPVAGDPASQPQEVPQPAGDGGEQPAAEQPAAEQPASEQPVEEAPPAEEPTPEPTTPPSAEVVINSNMNVRGGPGTNYNIVGGANQGERYVVTGRNDDGSWWQIDYSGQAGWVFGDLVSATNVETVAVAQNIPAPPPPPTPVPATPTPAPPPPAAEAPAPAPSDNFPFLLVDTARCDPNAGQTYFNGFVRDSNNNPLNAVCVHINFYEPRTTKCSGCDGVGDGNWGFSPFGGPAPQGTPIEIYVVPCPPNLPPGGQSSGFDDLTPQSPKWTRVINESEQCTGITFVRK
jgi:hypothetical protein